jgi:hypothetical protein
VAWSLLPIAANSPVLSAHLNELRAAAIERGLISGTTYPEVQANSPRDSTLIAAIRTAINPADWWLMSFTSEAVWSQINYNSTNGDPNNLFYCAFGDAYTWRDATGPNTPVTAQRVNDTMEVLNLLHTRAIQFYPVDWYRTGQYDNIQSAGNRIDFAFPVTVDQAIGYMNTASFLPGYTGLSNSNVVANSLEYAARLTGNVTRAAFGTARGRNTYNYSPFASVAKMWVPKPLPLGALVSAAYGSLPLARTLTVKVRTGTSEGDFSAPYNGNYLGYGTEIDTLTAGVQTFDNEGDISIAPIPPADHLYYEFSSWIRNLVMYPVVSPFTGCGLDNTGNCELLYIWNPGTSGTSFAFPYWTGAKTLVKGDLTYVD